jgi:DNA-binding NarL/FixJ family response regulator
MAAEGLANREIAQRLFVTQRTVETHLMHVYQKLDIHTRAALAPELFGNASLAPALYPDALPNDFIEGGRLTE